MIDNTKAFLNFHISSIYFVCLSMYSLIRIENNQYKSYRQFILNLFSFEEFAVHFTR